MRKNNLRRDRSLRVRKGYTLLELIATSGLLALVIVPSLELTRESLDLGHRLESKAIMTSLCLGKLEEHLAIGAIDLSETTTSGSFASIGHAQLRYAIVRSQETSDGGITDRLMAVSAIVWDDINGNLAQDSGEPSITFASKIAKTRTYNDEASGA